MILNLIIFLLLSNALTIRRDQSILFSRIVAVNLLGMVYISWTASSFTALEKGLAIFGGIFSIDALTQSFQMFVIFISATIIALTYFLPRVIYIISLICVKLWLVYCLVLFINKTGFILILSYRLSLINNYLGKMSLGFTHTFFQIKPLNQWMVYLFMIFLSYLLLTHPVVITFLLSMYLESTSFLSYILDDLIILSSNDNDHGTNNEDTKNESSNEDDSSDDNENNDQDSWFEDVKDWFYEDQDSNNNEEEGKNEENHDQNDNGSDDNGSSYFEEILGWFDENNNNNNNSENDHVKSDHKSEEESTESSDTSHQNTQDSSHHDPESSSNQDPQSSSNQDPQSSSHQDPQSSSSQSTDRRIDREGMERLESIGAQSNRLIRELGVMIRNFDRARALDDPELLTNVLLNIRDIRDEIEECEMMFFIGVGRSINNAEEFLMSRMDNPGYAETLLRAEDIIETYFD